MNAAHGGRKVTQSRAGSGGVRYEFMDATVNLNGRLGSVELVPSPATSRASH
ncbi:hypothetical protein [Streptomyces sp. NPDC047014]|uniref:hypothetical protein n=1 Tax=Streptomyces sp. NPDC047014 TaxID=3155736 RepID=UPI0033F0C07B